MSDSSLDAVVVEEVVAGVVVRLLQEHRHHPVADRDRHPVLRDLLLLVDRARVADAPPRRAAGAATGTSRTPRRGRAASRRRARERDRVFERERRTLAGARARGVHSVAYEHDAARCSSAARAAGRRSGRRRPRSSRRGGSRARDMDRRGAGRAALRARTRSSPVGRRARLGSGAARWRTSTPRRCRARGGRSSRAERGVLGLGVGSEAVDAREAAEADQRPVLRASAQPHRSTSARASRCHRRRAGCRPRRWCRRRTSPARRRRSHRSP